ncbi:MAG: SEL1-like repeat protein, partial [Bauldia sp.]
APAETTSEPRPAQPSAATSETVETASISAPMKDDVAMPADGDEQVASAPAAAEEEIAGFEPVPVDAGPVALREAADSGDPKALFEVGSRYAEGRKVKTDMAAAAKWYERSAELGFAPAQYRIGNFFEKGTGVDRDIAKAKTWYQLAAEQGNASAMHNLAVLYAMGADGVADNDSAARWFIKAAELGVKDSQFNLGILAAKGVGVPQDLEESYKWFALVAKAGDRDAAAKRDEVANALRPEQLARARATVELWKPKPVDPEANVVEIPEGWEEPGTKTASVDMKKAVANIQKILNKNGYEAGGADGVMGEKTKAAIIAFQSDNGLDPTGEIDEKLIKVLLEKK